jgi:hypothetical protein
MSWLITPSQPVPLDPYRSNVSLLLYGDGANGSTTITDSSPTPKVMTVGGNAQISTAQSKFGGSSLVFDGNGDFLLSAADRTLDITAVPWTIEFFAYFLTLGNRAIVNMVVADGANAGVNIYTASSGAPLRVDDGVAADTGPSGGALSVNTWYHIAVTSASNSVRLFIDGALVNTYTGAVSASRVITRVKLGKLGSTGLNDFHGYLEEVRITKGVARYTANFTPPTTAFPDI